MAITAHMVRAYAGEPFRQSVGHSVGPAWHQARPEERSNTHQNRQDSGMRTPRRQVLTAPGLDVGAIKVRPGYCVFPCAASMIIRVSK
jgi:hypothetical protein